MANDASDKLPAEQHACGRITTSD